MLQGAPAEPNSGSGVGGAAPSSSAVEALMEAARLGDSARVVALLEEELSPNATDATGRTALHWAARNGHVDSLHKLLAAGSSQLADSKGDTPLILAAYGGHVDCLCALIAAGASLEAADSTGSTALHWAAAQGQEACLQALLKAGACIEAADEGKATALHFAAAKGKPACLASLLEAGAHASAANGAGLMPLHLAAAQGHAQCITLLAAEGAELDAVDARGSTALHWAAEHGREESIVALAAAGASINATDGLFCRTPLHWAADEGRGKAAAALLKAGSAVDATDMDGATALHLAAAKGHIECVHRLLDGGASIEAADLHGSSTALHWAVEGGHPESIAVLAGKGACLDAADITESTALHLAVQRGSADCVAALLTAGAAVGAADGSGMTALHWAAQHGRVEIAASLLRVGADVAKVDSSGRTALHYAAEAGHTGCTAQLLAAGTDSSTADKEDSSALDLAIRQGHSEVVSMLQAAAGGSPPVQQLAQQVEEAHGQAGPASAAGYLPQVAVMEQRQPALAAPSAALVDCAPWQIQFADLNFRQQPPLGSGSYGKVYLGLLNKAQVAIKVLDGRSEADTALADFKKEAAVLAKLLHDNIVAFRGLCIDPPCIVTEYCAHGSLHGMLTAARHASAARRPSNLNLNWPRILNMALDAAKGMLHLHSQKPPVIHRDLKAANLLVGEGYRVKVADFGLSKVWVDDGLSVTSASGPDNPRWLAPEVLCGKRATTASDVYSWGMVMWELLTWELPWEQVAHHEISHRVLSGGQLEVPPYESLPAGTEAHQLDECDAGLGRYVELMKSCWEQDPTDRPSFYDIVTILSDMLERAQQRAQQPEHTLRAGWGGTAGKRQRLH